MGYRVINGVLHPVGNFIGTEDKKSINNEKSCGIRKEKVFDDFLKDEINKTEGFVLSNHAASRLKERNIELNKELMGKINEGINKANEKGSKESLILYENIGLIASIKNRTIITAIDKNENQSNVITNIDSVVLL